MKILLMGILALCGCVFSMATFAAETIEDPSTGLVFPKEVSFDSNGKQYQLQATGIATRKKLVIKVYSIASYLQKGIATGGDKLQSILSDANAKQLDIKWARDVSSNQIKEAFESSFHKVFQGEQYTQLQKVINQFIQLFNQEAKKGDEMILRWIPGGNIEVWINGNKIGSLTNAAFARGLWLIWFGDNSIVNRNSLLSETS